MATLPIQHAEFASTLKRLMGEKFGTKDLMRATDATFASCSRWQSGQAYPRKGALRQICGLLGVSMEELTGKPDHYTGAIATVVSNKPASSFQTIALRLDSINSQIESLKAERDMLKIQLMDELNRMDSDT